MSNKGVHGSRIPSEVQGTVGHCPSANNTTNVDRRSFLLCDCAVSAVGRRLIHLSFSSQSSMGASALDVLDERAPPVYGGRPERGGCYEDACGQRAALEPWLFAATRACCHCYAAWSSRALSNSKLVCRLCQHFSL